MNTERNTSVEKGVIEGIPGHRYLKDGMSPFCLCLEGIAGYLGINPDYDTLLGHTGACYRMSWNCRKWDEGNMDLRNVWQNAFETFRRGLTSIRLSRHNLLSTALRNRVC